MRIQALQRCRRDTCTQYSSTVHRDGRRCKRLDIVDVNAIVFYAKRDSTHDGTEEHEPPQEPSLCKVRPKWSRICADMAGYVVTWTETRDRQDIPFCELGMG